MAKGFLEVFPDLHMTTDMEELLKLVDVERVSSTRDRSSIRIYIVSQRLIHKKNIYDLEKGIREQLFPGKKLTIKIVEKYRLSGQYTPQKLFQVYKDSLLMELKHYSIIEYNILRRAECTFPQENILRMTVEDNAVFREKTSELKRILEKVFHERCGLPVDVIYEYIPVKENQESQQREAQIQREINDRLVALADKLGDGADAAAPVKKEETAHSARTAGAGNGGNAAPAVKTASGGAGAGAAAASGANGGGEWKKPFSRDRKFGGSYQKKSDNPDVLYGRDFDDEFISIRDIAGEMGEVTIRGQIINTDSRLLKSGKTIVIFDVTDFTDTITVKLFAREEMLEDINKAVVKKNFIKLRGMTTIDKFDGELTIGSVVGIKKCEDFTGKRNDNSLVKRIELHCHTKMSDMDGVSNVADIIKRAKKWGMPALAVTDHGCVQAFTEASHSLDKNDPFKVIYGVEGYLVDDTKQLVEDQEAIYVAIAVALCCVVLMLTMDSILLPFIFLLCIGVSILWNMGTNYFLGEISYITKAVAAVLQLGVTLDYSIFLWHSYKEEQQTYSDKDEAMASAICKTISSIVGSSLTTVAGFVAICFMSFTLGRDLGIVMSKGVILGVLGTVILLPCVIRILDRALEKTSHKPLLPSVAGISKFVTKHYKVLFVLLIVLCIPAFYGYNHVGKYYDMSACLPQELESVKANTKLSETFDVSTNHLVLVDADVPQKDVVAMTDEMAEVDGVKQVLSIDSLLGAGIPESIVPDEILSELKSNEYQLMLISSEYIISSDAVNRQIDELNEILKKYDEGGMLIGEAPCTKDLISCTDHDFEVVSLISIIAIFLIIALVLRSISLPVILVAVIETAIAANLCIPYYTNVTLPFVAPILISTIQLGSTVDYAILMTTRYLQNRRAGSDKREAVSKAVASSAQSILVSGIGFFAATFGVGLYSNVDIISSMCSLMARGALCSVVVVLFLLPTVLLVLDKVIIHTTLKVNAKN